MNRRNTKIAVLLAVLSLPVGLRAQETPLTPCQQTEFNLLWKDFSNPSSMTFLPQIAVSKADLAGQSSNGGLCGVDESPSALAGNISTGTYARLSEKLAFAGGMFYNYYYGKRMGGPVFMDPSYNPVNFYESVDTTKGIKIKELYGVDAIFAYSLSDAWSIGAGFDYISGNMAKRSDPRYRNAWMDMNISAGVNFRSSDSFAAGLSAIFRKTTEKAYSGLFGFKDIRYFTFVDYGVGIGIRESLDGMYNHLASSASGHPMMNYIYGGALQIHAGITDHELRILHRQGYYGENNSREPKFSVHSGNTFSYGGKVDFKSSDAVHRINLNGSFETLDSFENDFTYSTDELNVTTVVYKGQRQSLKRSDISADLSYQVHWNRQGDIHLWSAGATADFSMRNTEGRVYPFYRRQNRICASADLWIQRNFILSSSILSTGLSVGFLSGGGNPSEKGQYAAGTSTTLKNLDTYVLPQFEFETATSGRLGLKIGWTRKVSDTFSYTLFLSDRIRALVNKPEYLSGRVRNVLTIGAGCNF